MPVLMLQPCLLQRGSLFFFFSSRRRHTIFDCDWSSDVCSSDLGSSRRISKWRCGAVDRPELPERAITCLAGTASPSCTSRRDACPYIVLYPPLDRKSVV